MGEGLDGADRVQAFLSERADIGDPVLALTRQDPNLSADIEDRDDDDRDQQQRHQRQL